MKTQPKIADTKPDYTTPLPPYNGPLASSPLNKKASTKSDSQSDKPWNQSHRLLKGGKKQGTRSGKGVGSIALRNGCTTYEPEGCLSGSEVVSKINRPFINVHGRYRPLSMPLDAMEKAGVPADVLEIFELANNLGAAGREGAGDKAVTAAELLAVESCISRKQLLPLEKAWALMELGDVAGIDHAQDLQSLKAQIIDRSIRPERSDLSNVAVSIDQLPQDARTDAAWARKVATGLEDGVLTLHDLKTAFETTDKTTPAQRDQYNPAGGALFACVKQEAASKPACDNFRAQLEIPNLGEDECRIVKTDKMVIEQRVEVFAQGALNMPETWTTSVPHQRSRGNDCPTAPPMSDFKFDLKRRHSFDVEIPAGHELVLTPECGHEGSDYVLKESGNIGRLKAGTYRAALMKDGEIVDESVFSVKQPLTTESCDLSNYYGYEMVSPDGPLGVVKTDAGFELSAESSTPFPDLHELPISTEPGLYEGTLHWKGYDRKVDYSLEILSKSTARIRVGDKVLELIPANRPTSGKQSGLELPAQFYQARLTDHFPGSMSFPASLILNPDSGNLQLVSDVADGCHTSTSWIYTRALGHLATNDLSKARIA